ncbi:PAS domain-containing protein [Halalkalibacillus halophilus]|uniref:PAS domain-containing protein n=1 Tax=Halalkalibacillus halophilus TaxID=392827 RepID=UPI0003F9D94E|nr:PAS domain-containing protein [Halalkalibacillus halophilus]
MPGNQDIDELTRIKQYPLKLVVFYLLIGFVWIATSDYILELFISDAQMIANLQLVKGLVYVVLTGVLLYLFLKKGNRSIVGLYEHVYGREKDLQLSDEVFENITQGLMITDERGKILKANEHLIELSGLPHDEIIGKRYEKLPYFQAGFESYLKNRRKLRKEGYWEGEVSAIRPDGSEIPMTLSIHEVRDRRGKLTNYFGIFVDLVESKQKERVLYETKKSTSVNYGSIPSWSSRM